MQDLRIKELCRKHPEIKGFLLDLEKNKQKNRRYKTESAHEKISKFFDRREDQS